MKKEKSAFGTPILIYDDAYEAINKNSIAISHNTEIENHVQSYLGDISLVYEEYPVEYEYENIDILIVNPTKRDPTFKLITSGMSSFPMIVPEGVNKNKYLELIMTLPPHWKFDNISLKKEEFKWPLRLMRMLATFPQDCNTAFSSGDTFGPDIENTCYAKHIKFCSVLLCETVRYPQETMSLKISDSKEISFLTIVPLFKEEVDFKLKNGLDALYEIMNSDMEIVNPNRANIITGAKK